MIKTMVTILLILISQSTAIVWAQTAAEHSSKAVELSE